MDRNYIENEHIVDRYLSGELTVREAREFEKYCMEHPKVLSTLAIPVRLKAQLAKATFADSETGVFEAIPSSKTRAAEEVSEEGFDQEEEAQWQRSYGGEKTSRWLVITLAVALVIAVGGAIFYAVQASSFNDKLKLARREMKTMGMEAPARVQAYPLQMSRVKPDQATLNAGWLQPPQLLDMRIEASDSKYNAYQITIDRVDGTRVMQIRRIARDSNRELRLALNSSAFGRGDFLMKIEGYTWRGQLEEVGWVRLGLE